MGTDWIEFYRELDEMLSHFIIEVLIPKQHQSLKETSVVELFEYVKAKKQEQEERREC